MGEVGAIIKGAALVGASIFLDDSGNPLGRFAGNLARIAGNPLDGGTRNAPLVKNDLVPDCVVRATLAYNPGRFSQASADGEPIPAMLGTGVAISPNVTLTVAHVCDAMNGLNGTNQPMSYGGVVSLGVHDTATLHLETPGRPPAQIANVKKFAEADLVFVAHHNQICDEFPVIAEKRARLLSKVFCYGFPGHLGGQSLQSAVPAAGRIVAIMEDGCYIAIFGRDTGAGDSGAPLLDKKGRLLGILKAGLYRGKSETGYAGIFVPLHDHRHDLQAFQASHEALIARINETNGAAA